MRGPGQDFLSLYSGARWPGGRGVVNKVVYEVFTIFVENAYLHFLIVERDHLHFDHLSTKTFNDSLITKILKLKFVDKNFEVDIPCSDDGS